jgi:hypothetical protein
MVLVLALMTASYFAVVLWVRRGTRTARAVAEAPGLALLPAEDQPPVSAVGWPPGGARFTAYVDDGFAALDAYLQEGFAA